MLNNLIVYLITNQSNGKLYIGKTSAGLRARWANHKAVAKRGKKSHFSSAIRKYGPELFRTEELGRASSHEQLANLERLWILLLKSTDPKIGYNCRSGGEGGLMPESFRRNVRERRLGQKHSTETKARMSIARRKYWQELKTGRVPPEFKADYAGQHEKRPGARTEFKAWVNTDPAIRIPKTQADFARKWKLTKSAISYWKRTLNFTALDADQR